MCPILYLSRVPNILLLSAKSYTFLRLKNIWLIASYLHAVICILSFTSPTAVSYPFLSLNPQTSAINSFVLSSLILIIFHIILFNTTDNLISSNPLTSSFDTITRIPKLKANGDSPIQHFLASYIMVFHNSNASRSCSPSPFLGKAILSHTLMMSVLNLKKQIVTYTKK